MAAVAASGKSEERAALAVITGELSQALRELEGVEADHALFARVAAAWADQPVDERARGVALDVALVHVASMSNLFAALGWMVIDLLTHPDEVERVRAGDRARAEVCALESTRLAQRSIMARYVVKPVTFDVGDVVHEVAAGATIATLLPLTNTSAAPGLDRWDPDRWNRRRLADRSALAAVELVTVFGHGRHTCPAQPFSLSTMTAAATRLFAAFDMEPGWTGHPLPVRTQIGGVARAGDPCPVHYRPR
jgi:cytochrome P450